MRTRSFLHAICLSFAIASAPALAGGPSGAATGANSIGNATGSSGSDGGDARVKKINQYSVKSYALMRQIVIAAGAPPVAPEAPAAAPQ